MTKTYTEEYSVTIERDLLTRDIRSEIWRDEEGRIHRGHGLPAVVKYGADSQEPIHVEFRFRGLLDRKDGPALEVTHTNGVVTREEWYCGNELHRNDGDALILRNPATGKAVHSERHVSELYIPPRKPAGPSMG